MREAVAESLPGPDIIAGALTATVESRIVDAVAGFAQGDAFQTAFVNVNKAAHDAAIAVIGDAIAGFLVAPDGVEREFALQLVQHLGRLPRACDQRGTAVVREASMTKLFCTEMANRVADLAVQIHGGLGVVQGTKVERLYREIRALRIYEGTSEIQRIVISRHVLANS